MGDQNLYLKVKGKGVQGTQFVECIAKVLNGSNEEIDHPFLVNVADILKSNEEPNFGWYEAIIQITEIEPEGDAHWVLLKTSHSFLVSGDRLLSGEIETNPKTLGKTKVKPKK